MIGLRHSMERSALMAPFYRGYEETVKLDIDDIRGIQDLYQPAKSSIREISNDISEEESPVSIVSRTDQRKPVKESDRSICESRHFDVILTDEEGRTFVFKVKSKLNIVVTITLSLVGRHVLETD